MDELFLNLITRDGINMNNIALVTIPSGRYANEAEFADKLTAYLDKQLKRDQPYRQLSLSLKFNTVSRKLVMDINCEPGVAIYLSKKCSEKLGFGKSSGYNYGIHVADSIFDINADQ